MKALSGAEDIAREAVSDHEVIADEDGIHRA
jgi:hypothetical protein